MTGSDGKGWGSFVVVCLWAVVLAVRLLSSRAVRDEIRSIGGAARDYWRAGGAAGRLAVALGIIAVIAAVAVGGGKGRLAIEITSARESAAGVDLAWRADPDVIPADSEFLIQEYAGGAWSTVGRTTATNHTVAGFGLNRDRRYRIAVRKPAGGAE